ncbi:MAG: dTMP kinase [bacterium]|nr:dTMP kinase [bacterium]
MTQKTTGKLITFEGIDGSGKSTHLTLSQKFLSERGFAVKVLREPGSTEVAERIRAILLDRKAQMSAMTELLLYEASRADIVEKQIVPLLRKGHIILLDRFYDSTTAYQGYGRKLDIKMVKQLNLIATNRVAPDLTLVFDVDVATGMSRLGKDLDRLESEPRAFFKRVRAGFLEIARKEKRRVKVIDASRPVEIVFADVTRHLSRKLDLA